MRYRSSLPRLKALSAEHTTVLSRVAWRLSYGPLTSEPQISQVPSLLPRLCHKIRRCETHCYVSIATSLSSPPTCTSFTASSVSRYYSIMWLTMRSSTLCSHEMIFAEFLQTPPMEFIPRLIIYNVLLVATRQSHAITRLVELGEAWRLYPAFYRFGKMSAHQEK